MSAISSRVPESQAAATQAPAIKTPEARQPTARVAKRVVPATRRRRPRIGALRGVRRGMVADVALAGFMSAMLALMVLLPGEETIPYHFLFLALTIVYGFRVWPLVPTMVVTVLVTGTT